jgi:hypothetical protein
MHVFSTVHLYVYDCGVVASKVVVGNHDGIYVEILFCRNQYVNIVHRAFGRVRGEPVSCNPINTGNPVQVREIKERIARLSEFVYSPKGRLW